MYLLDTEGNVHTDEYPANEHMVAALKRTQPTLVLLPEYNLLYRYEENGDITLYFIGGKQYKKVTITLYGMHVYQDTGGYIDENVRLVRFASEEAQVYVDDVVFTMPEKLLTLW